MAFDGFVIANLVYDFNQSLKNGRIYKIYQPENDEIILVIKNEKVTYRLDLCASASLPLIYFTSQQKENPMVAPNFCMLLRKYINNGRIISITQPSFERIIDIEIEHLDELGDLCKKHLITEVMGKHSNIIFCDESYKIIDSIKHVNAMMSSLREVLPGRDYKIAPTQHKENPVNISENDFFHLITEANCELYKAVYSSLTGVSPVMANELCFRAGLPSDIHSSECTKDQLSLLFQYFDQLRLDTKTGDFHPEIIYRKNEPMEFSPFHLTMYSALDSKEFTSISEVIETYYAEKSAYTRMHQKSTDLRKIVTTAIERTSKKYDLQKKQLNDTKKRDKYKVYGELLNTYGYQCPPKAKSLEALNYYTNEMITIPLDPNLTPTENAKKYFNKYNKLKRTNQALSTLIEETKSSLLHLKSIQTSLNLATSESDLLDIKTELTEYGYIKKHMNAKKRKPAKSKPLHFLSSDGFHIYVGKNNYQNDELTFKFANTGDWWFHANDMPGSHVIVKKEQAKELPDATFEEAAKLAAYYSEGRSSSKVEIDYTTRGNIKKPNGAKPGFVIYHTNYSMIAEPDITGIQQIS